MKNYGRVALLAAAVCSGYLFFASRPRVASATVESGTAADPVQLEPETYVTAAPGNSVAWSMIASALYDVGKAFVMYIADQANESSWDGLTGYAPSGAYIPVGALDPPCLDCMAGEQNAH